MAFVSTLNNNAVPNRVGDKKDTSGTYLSSGGSTGGDIDTGLKVCEELTMTKNGAAVGNAQAVNETLPADGSAITVVTDANEGGYWRARGY